MPRRTVAPQLLRAYATVLRDARKAAHLSQEKLIRLASRAGLPVPNRVFISALENARQEPGLGTQVQLARAIGVRASGMLRKVEEMLLPTSERQCIDLDDAHRIPLGVVEVNTLT